MDIRAYSRPREFAVVPYYKEHAKEILTWTCGRRHRKGSGPLEMVESCVQEFPVDVGGYPVLADIIDPHTAENHTFHLPAFGFCDGRMLLQFPQGGWYHPLRGYILFMAICKEGTIDPDPLYAFEAVEIRRAIVSIRAEIRVEESQLWAAITRRRA